MRTELKNIQIHVEDGRKSTNVVQFPPVIISSFTCGKLKSNSNMIYTILRESEGHGSIDNHIWRLNSQENKIGDNISSDDPKRFFVGEKIPIHFFAKYFQYPFDLISSSNLDVKFLSTKISEDDFLCNFHVQLSDIKMRSPPEKSNFQPKEENIFENFLHKNVFEPSRKYPAIFMANYLAKNHVVLKLDFSRNLTKEEFQIPDFVRFCKEALVEKAIEEGGHKISEMFKNDKEFEKDVEEGGHKISEMFKNAKDFWKKEMEK